MSKVWQRCFGWVRYWRLFGALAVVTVGSFYAFVGFSLVWLDFFDPPTSALQVQRRWERLIDPSYRKQYSFVPLERISEHLQHAVIAAEDGRFYEHGGIDWDELQNAMEANLERGRFWRGGSTISQQLVKNLFLTSGFGFLRKGVEFTLAPLAERMLSKERILELYLNVIEWGDGVYGIEAAAREYYGISAAQLSREQSARLAACLPAPRTRRPGRMHRYSREILRRMETQGW